MQPPFAPAFFSIRILDREMEPDLTVIVDPVGAKLFSKCTFSFLDDLKTAIVFQIVTADVFSPKRSANRQS